MSSFEEKLEAFLEEYQQLKSVENEEAFLKEFMVCPSAIMMYGASLCATPPTTVPADAKYQPTNLIASPLTVHSCATRCLMSIVFLVAIDQCLAVIQ